MAQGSLFQRFKLSGFYFWFQSALIFVKSKSVHLLLFLVINAVIGSLGVWLPILSTIGRPDLNAYQELHKVLLASGPYTFAVAYLASSTSYIASEYLESQVTRNRKLKVTLALVAFVLLILCALLTALNTASPSASISQTQHLSVASPEKAVQSADQLHATQHVGEPPNTGDNLQIGMVALSILVGLLLHVVSRIDDSDIRDEWAKISESRQREADELKLRAESAGSPGLKL